jgi:hypothetical protein
MNTAPSIRYTMRPDTSPEAELNALAAIYEYVLCDSQARKGAPHDLTRGSTKRLTRTDKKGTDNADIHGN